MRINKEDKQMEMERRDINYIFPAYLKAYLFYNKNQTPDKIIFPMFSEVTIDGVKIPIEYVPELSNIAVDIKQDGADIPEVTSEKETELDMKDDAIKEIKEIAKDPISKQPAARKAFVSGIGVDRKPKMPPGGDIGPGLPLSDMHSRDRKDQSRTRADLAEGPDIDESKEKPYEKNVSRDSSGNPVVEENQDELIR